MQAVFSVDRKQLSRNLSFFLIVPLTTLVMITIVLALIVSSYQSAHDGRIYTGVSVWGIDLSEKTPAEAEAAPVNPYIIDDSVPRFPEQVFDAIPAEFHEAPMLAEKVAAGDLPPVAERLPAEPMVLKPSDQIGVYGGTLNGAFTGPADHQNAERMLKNHILFWDTGMTTVQPHIARAFEANADNTEFTFHLREGMKWSDGEPFTADDIMFWYQDIMLNDDGPAPADTRVPETATGIAQLRLLTVAEASANERCQRRFDDEETRG